MQRTQVQFSPVHQFDPLDGHGFVAQLFKSLRYSEVGSYALDSGSDLPSELTHCCMDA